MLGSGELFPRFASQGGPDVAGSVRRWTDLGDRRNQIFFWKRRQAEIFQEIFTFLKFTQGILDSIFRHNKAEGKTPVVWNLVMLQMGSYWT